MLPMLQMCKTINGYEPSKEKLLKLMRLGIGGSVLGERNNLSLCHEGDGSVISPVVFLRKPNKAHLSIREGSYGANVICSYSTHKQKQQ